MEHPFDIDGIVIKSRYCSETGVERSLGFKFSIENRTTTIKGLHFNICGKGFVRALLEVKPVKFSNGRTVSSISLPDMRKARGLHEGTSVIVKYTGGLHPSLDSVVESTEARGPKIVVPTNCPHCEQILEQTPSGNLRCTNKLCHRQHSASLEHFIAKVGLGGSPVAKELINSGIVSSPFDFYSLMPEDLQVSTGFSQQKVNDFMVSLNLSKKTPFPVFLRALKLGHTEKLLRAASSFSELLNLDEEQLGSIKPEAAEEILSIVEKNKPYFKQLADAGVCIDNPSKSTDVSKKYEAYSTRIEQIRSTSTDLFQLLNTNERETRTDIASFSAEHETFAAEWKREQSPLSIEEKKLAKALSRYLELAKPRGTGAQTELSKLLDDERESSLWE